MSEHTKEPWSNPQPWLILDKEGNVVLYADEKTRIAKHLRHIVACVNACREFTTYQLECVGEEGSNVNLRITGFPMED